MAVLLTIPQQTFPPVQFTTNQLTLPLGAQKITVVYTTPSWPVVSDGTITLSLQVSDDNGVSFRNEWSDVVQHELLTKTPTSQTFEVFLSKPFSSVSKLKVGINSTVAITTAVTINAN